MCSVVGSHFIYSRQARDLSQESLLVDGVWQPNNKDTSSNDLFSVSVDHARLEVAFRFVICAFWKCDEVLNKIRSVRRLLDAVLANSVVTQSDDDINRSIKDAAEPRSVADITDAKNAPHDSRALFRVPSARARLYVHATHVLFGLFAHLPSEEMVCCCVFACQTFEFVGVQALQDECLRLIALTTLRLSNEISGLAVDWCRYAAAADTASLQYVHVAVTLLFVRVVCRP